MALLRKRLREFCRDLEEAVIDRGWGLSSSVDARSVSITVTRPKNVSATGASARSAGDGPEARAVVDGAPAPTDYAEHGSAA